VSVAPGGGPISIGVATTSACTWTPLTSASFIAVTSPAGQSGSGTATFSVAGNTGAARSGSVTIGGQIVTVNQGAAVAAPPPSGSDGLLGNWSGTITMNVGCAAGLPLTYTWTGTFRAGGATGTELVITVPNTPITGRVFPVTLSGNSIAFSVPFDSTYNFTGIVGSDRRSIPNGSFVGSNCAPTGTAIIPSGSWTGIHQ